MDKNVSDIAEKLFEMACSGDIDNLDTYYKITGSLDVVCHKFGDAHSLLMGAFRNQQWDTVCWLLEHGAKLTASEQKEVDTRCREMALLFRMSSTEHEAKAEPAAKCSGCEYFCPDEPQPGFPGETMYVCNCPCNKHIVHIDFDPSAVI